MSNDWDVGGFPARSAAGEGPASQTASAEEAGAVFDGEPMMVLVETTAPLEEVAIIISADERDVEASKNQQTGLGLMAVSVSQPVLLVDVALADGDGYALRFRSALNPMGDDGQRMVERLAGQETLQLIFYTPHGEPLGRRILSLDRSIHNGLVQTLSLCEGVQANEETWFASIKTLDEAGMLLPGAGLEES